MTFIVVFIAALIERFFDWSHLRCWQWYVSYERWIMQRIPGKSSYLVLGIAVISLLIIVALLQALFDGLLYGLIKLLFELAVFIYCLGPRNLWADTFACINAVTKGDAHLAEDKLKSAFGLTEINHKPSLHRGLLNHIFVEANHRVFAVIFWFVVLGPVGALLYRVVALSAATTPAWEVSPELSQSARKVEAVLDWVPVRVLTFIFALGGHFSQVISIWSKKVNAGLNSNDALLVDCGFAALGKDDHSSLLEDGSVERSAVSLLDRSFVITLVLVVIVTLVF